MLKTEQNHGAAAKAPALKSKSLERRLLSYAALPAALAFSGSAADAAFVGPYDVANWTTASNAGDGFVDTAGAPGSVTLNGSNTGVFSSGLNWFIDFTIAAVSDGIVSFNWDYSTTDLPGYDFGSYLLNGTPVRVTSGNSGSLSGFVSFAVNDGDTFGFRVLSDDDFGGRGVLTITNFDAPEDPSAVPEPTTLSLLALGAAGLALTRRRKKQS